MGFSKYPTQLDDNNTLPLAVDLVTPVNAECVNRTRDAILSIETELGTDPSSSFGTVRARLDDLTNQINTLKDLTGISESQQLELDTLQAQVDALSASFDVHVITADAHFVNISNPHSVTAAQAGAPNKLGSSTDEAIMRYDGISGQMQDSAAGPYVTNTGDLRMTERAGDPINVANNGFLYTKDVSGTTELFYLDSAGNPTQLTIVGGSPVTGTGVDDRIVRWNGTTAIQSSGITVNDTDNMSGATSISAGSAPVSTIGAFRMGASDVFAARNGANTADVIIAQVQSSNIILGSTSNSLGQTLIDAATGRTIQLRVNGAAQIFLFDSDSFDIPVPTVQFNSTVAAPNILQTADAGDGGGGGVTGQPFLFHSQDVTGIGTTNIGGELSIRAGDAANGGSNTGGNIIARPGNGLTANGYIDLQDGGGTSRVVITAGGDISAFANTTVQLGAAGASRMNVTNTIVQIRVPNLEFEDNELNPTIYQEDDITAGAGVTGDLLTIHSQDTPGTGLDNVGGGLLIRAGDATNGTNSNTGGNLDIRPGSGPTIDGTLALQDGDANDRITVTSTVIQITPTSRIDLGIGGTRAQVLSTGIQLLNSAALFWDAATSPNIFQTTNSGDGGGGGVTGDLFSIQAQDVTGTGTTNIGGGLTLRAGNAANGGTNTGGDLTLTAGTGLTANGVVYISNSPLRMAEITSDPTAIANSGFVYVKDSGGISELYYEDDAGTVTQLTADGYTSAPGSGTDNSIVRWNGTTGLQDSGVTLDDGDNMSGVETVSFGAIPSTTGNALNFSNNFSVYARNAANTFDAPVMAYNASNQLLIGSNSTNHFSLVQITAPGGANSGIRFNCQEIGFQGLLASATFNIVDNNASVTPVDMTFHSQDNNFAGASFAGDLTIRAGDGSAGTSTGGNFTLRPGSGITTDGVLTMQSGVGSDRFTISAAGVVTVGEDAATDGKIRVFNESAVHLFGDEIVFINTGNTVGVVDNTGFKVHPAAIIGYGFFSTHTGPIINQDDDFVSGTGAPFLIHSQDVAGSNTTKIGGALTIRGGDSTTGAGTNETGGALTLRPGAGGTGSGVHGVLALQDGGGTDRVTIDAAGNLNLDSATNIYMRHGAGDSIAFSDGALVFTSTTDFSHVVATQNIISGSYTLTVHGADMTGTTGSLAGGTLDLRAGNATGVSTNNTGGALTLFAGDASGAGTSNTGGALTIRPGAGSGAGSTDGILTIQGGDGTARFTIDAAGEAIVNGQSQTWLRVAGANVMRAVSTGVQLFQSTLYWEHTIAAPVFQQQDSSIAAGKLMSINSQNTSFAGGSGGSLAINAGNSTGTGTKAGGDLTIKAGVVSGSGGTNTGGTLTLLGGTATAGTVNQGGDIIIKAGTGTAGNNGFIQLQDVGSTPRLTILGPSGDVELGTSTDLQWVENYSFAQIGPLVRAGGASGSDFWLHGQDATSAGTAGDLAIFAGENASGGGGTLELHAGTGNGAGNHGFLALIGGDDTWKLQIDENADLEFLVDMRFDNGVVTPVIYQADQTSGTASDNMSIHAQDLTSTTGTKTAGDLTIRPGNCTGTGTANNAGNLILLGGESSGGTLDNGGDVTLRAGLGDSSDSDGIFYIETPDSTPRITVHTDIKLGHTNLVFDDVLDANCLITISTTADDGYDLTVQAQNSSGSGLIGGDLYCLAGNGSGTNGNGGHAIISGGTNSGTGLEGNIAFRVLPSTWQSMEGGIFLADRVGAPTGDPTSGGFMYSESGAGKWRGSSGTITTFGPAEPHCPDCGRDSALEWKNDKDEWELSICMWCVTDKLGDVGVIKKEQK